jgi:hypothetical protein
MAAEHSMAQGPRIADLSKPDFGSLAYAIANRNVPAPRPSTEKPVAHDHRESSTSARH